MINSVRGGKGLKFVQRGAVVKLRHIVCKDGAHEDARQFCKNNIKTSKYSPWTFIPKNLAEQFSQLANVYFLVIAFMQMVPYISISGGKPAMLLPLSFVITVSAIKDLYEDLKRHSSDNEEN